MNRLGLCLGLTGLLWAQDPEALEIKSGDQVARLAREWVHDQDPRQRAWAAYWAGRDRLKSLIPELVQNLNSYSLGNEPFSYPQIAPEDAAIQSVADALIRMNATVPAGAIMNLYPKFPAQTLILLAKPANRDPKSLYRIFEDTRITNVWLGAADLLAASHPEWIARRLLEDFTATVSIRVVNPQKETPAEFFVGGGCAEDFALGKTYNIKWPKIREYSLETDQKQLPLVSPGRANVYSFSWESNDYIPHPSSGTCVPKRVFLYGLLEQLAGAPTPSFVLRSDPTKTVMFLSDSQYRSDVSSFMRLQKQAFEQVVQTFIKGKLLAEATSLQLHAALEVDDQRSKHEPLPAIDFTEVGILERSPD